MRSARERDRDTNTQTRTEREGGVCVCVCMCVCGEGRGGKIEKATRRRTDRQTTSRQGESAHCALNKCEVWPDKRNAKYL